MLKSVPVTPGVYGTPMVRIVTLDHPWKWLAAGWRSTLATWPASLAYGVVFALLGYSLLYLAGDQFYLVLALTAGFLLVGPFLALGFFDIARHLEQGRRPPWFQAFAAWRGLALPVLLFGLLVGIVMLFWGRVTALLYGLIVNPVDSVLISEGFTRLFFTTEGQVFLLIFLVIWTVLALAVFTLSAVSIPMILDRRCDFVTAVLTSVKAVTVNRWPMLLWAELIVVFTGMGLVTFYIGLVITLPLIAHASWHAYRDLVELV